jgi:hypothetical protein
MLKWKCQKYESKHCQSKSSKETENAYWWSNSVYIKLEMSSWT